MAITELKNFYCNDCDLNIFNLKENYYGPLHKATDNLV